MRFLRRFTRFVDDSQDRLGAGLRWLALVMVLIGAYNAVARYLTRYTGTALSSNALNELQWYLFSVIFLLGAAYAIRQDVHVRVDVLYTRLSRKGQAWVDLLGGLLFLIPFSVLMLWVSFPAVRNSWAIREVSPDPGGLPRWPIKALILVSFALLVVQGVSETVKSLALIRGETWPLDEGPEGSDEIVGPGDAGRGDRAAPGDADGAAEPGAPRDDAGRRSEGL